MGSKLSEDMSSKLNKVKEGKVSSRGRTKKLTRKQASPHKLNQRSSNKKNNTKEKDGEEIKEEVNDGVFVINGVITE
ncbi:hypothetical protein Pmani_032539 [Petrolisthes manimaculis]|uniref:Uncharacterized protein n=1 Tax=Petrolisthes manimaculis TaxID=1843537 RepID=A0AAE1TTN9_9EUCA|nr:hypothetical protein Pmani_032539 [Petrolisthes manimaculis]